MLQLKNKSKGSHTYLPEDNALAELWSKSEKASVATDADIEIFGVIEHDKTLPEVSKKLKELNGADVVVAINSPGGDYDEGAAVANLLKDYKGKVTTVNLSLAASSAANIFLAGDERIMFPSAQVMIHAVWGQVIGNSDRMRAAADRMDKSTKQMIDSFFGTIIDATEDEILALMKAEEFLTAEQCKPLKICTAIYGQEEEKPEEEEQKAEADEDKEKEEQKAETEDEEKEDQQNSVDPRVRAYNKALDGINDKRTLIRLVV